MPPQTLSPPEQAMWWLHHGEFKRGPSWDKAHTICQTAEGTFEYDLVHALAHWIEGDIENRDYWYAQCGKAWRPAATIAEEWSAISKSLASMSSPSLA